MSAAEESGAPAVDEEAAQVEQPAVPFEQVSAEVEEMGALGSFIVLESSREELTESQPNFIPESEVTVEADGDVSGQSSQQARLQQLQDATEVPQSTASEDKQIPEEGEYVPPSPPSKTLDAPDSISQGPIHVSSGPDAASTQRPREPSLDDLRQRVKAAFLAKKEAKEKGNSIGKTPDTKDVPSLEGAPGDLATAEVPAQVDSIGTSVEGLATAAHPQAEVSDEGAINGAEVSAASELVKAHQPALAAGSKADEIATSATEAVQGRETTQGAADPKGPVDAAQENADAITTKSSAIPDPDAAAAAASNSAPASESSSDSDTDSDSESDSDSDPDSDSGSSDASFLAKKAEITKMLEGGGDGDGDYDFDDEDGGGGNPGSGANDAPKTKNELTLMDALRAQQGAAKASSKKSGAEGDEGGLAGLATAAASKLPFQQVPPEKMHHLQYLGKVHSVVDGSVLVVEQDLANGGGMNAPARIQQQQQYGYPSQAPQMGNAVASSEAYSVLDTGSLLCAEDGKVLGSVSAVLLEQIALAHQSAPSPGI